MQGLAILGVDVSKARGLDVALIVGGAVEGTWTGVRVDELETLLRGSAPAALAVDAPPRPGLGLLMDDGERAALPVPPAPGRHRFRRVAEYELSRRGIGSHQTHADRARLFPWMEAGFEAYEAAARAGYRPYLGTGDPRGRALEVFPYASYVALAGCLSPGRRLRTLWRRSVLVAAGVRGLPAGAGIDLLDAVCAALTGERFTAGGGSWVGDPREGVIVLPVPGLEDRYHRCPPRTEAEEEGR